MATKSSRNRRFKKQRIRVLDAAQWTCFYCGGPADQVDHRLPVVRGGDDSIENLVSCCKTCNLRKGTKSQGLFLERLATPPVFRASRSPQGQEPALIGPFEGQSKPQWI